MSDNHILTREAFFEACKARRVSVVELPGIGRVNIRRLTLGQLKLFDEAKDNYERAKLLILHSIVDRNSEPIFATTDEVDQLEMPVFKALSDAVTDVNALKVDETAIKNSATAKTTVLN
jgi:hypothetical protein